MVREFRIGVPNSLLDAVRAETMLWALCRHCGHSARLNPRSLAYRFGAVDMEFIVRRLKCIRCGHRHGAICPDYRRWPTMR